ncbi:KamA family radical SAM protein [Anaerophilus nitritogenes]|uniref:KamA family radical SAM protein n=1 Tax=Anaerophilus nitritogenes TaxID=2498136 RepID=UPI00101CBDCD|nr:KamA family radical SAM protein [Anaerophilus nitritogenes]
MFRVEEGYELKNKITPAIKALIDEKDSSDPIYRQFIVNEKELNILEEEIEDPIGDDRFSKVKGIIHRYPDRALLIPKRDCLVGCRFCFRKWKLPEKNTELTEQEIYDAIEYIKQTPEIWEVILTGGEPLATSEKKLELIIGLLNKIDHVKMIRIHSRVPIVAPEKITPKLINILKKDKPVWIVIHCNHAKEITTEVKRGCKTFVEAGIPLLSQTALLEGVNANVEALDELFRKLITISVKPYYLHHCDLVPGTSHFRTSIKQGQNLMKALRGRLSGICQPTYVLDIPNGYGKIPIGPNYVTYDSNEDIIVTDYKENQHDYPPISKDKKA